MRFSAGERTPVVAPSGLRGMAMRSIAFVLAVLLSLSAPQVIAQPQDNVPASTARVQESASAEEASRLNAIRSELKEMSDELRAWQIPGGLTAGQAFGFAAGIVVGAIVADALGGGGLVTLALALSGGAVGSWIMSY